MSTLPIELDELITRYLSDIEFEYDMKHNNDVLNERSSKILVKRFIANEDEVIDHQTEERFNAFVDYFTKSKILLFHSYEDYWEQHLQNTSLEPKSVIHLKDPYKEIIYTTYLDVEVKDIDKVRQFRKEHCGKINNSKKKSDPLSTRFASETQSIVTLNGAVYKPNKKEIGNMLAILWPERKERGQRNKSNPIAVTDVAESIFKNTSRTNIEDRKKKVLAFVKSVNNQLKEKRIPMMINNSNNKLQIIETKGKNS